MLRGNINYYTESVSFFNESKRHHFIGQLQSSCEGINLSKADALVFMNIDFSCKTYIQAKDRMTTKDRVAANKVYYVFAKGGMEDKIYKSVKKKESYSTKDFTRDFVKVETVQGSLF